MVFRSSKVLKLRVSIPITAQMIGVSRAPPAGLAIPANIRSSPTDPNTARGIKNAQEVHDP
jgi:hypothetical protein